VTYLLDANVLIDFQNADLLPELARASYSVEIAVVEKVYFEVTRPKSDDSPQVTQKKQTAARELREAKIDRIEVTPGTDAERLMAALLAPRREAAKKDEGEAASIAVAKTAPHLVFVTRDDKATFWALNELYGTGERVMRVPVFIRTLFEQGALPASAVQRIAGQLRNIRAIPSWWDVWLSAVDQLHSQISAPAFSQN